MNGLRGRSMTITIQMFKKKQLMLSNMLDQQWDQQWKTFSHEVDNKQESQRVTEDTRVKADTAYLVTGFVIYIRPPW